MQDHPTKPDAEASAPACPPCACGCGQPVRRASNRFLHGHSGGRNRGIGCVTLHCQHCGRTFERYPSRVSRYCSRSCAVMAPHTPRKYPGLQRDFFHVIDTPQKAYILGFVIADGAIGSDGRSWCIGILERDRPLLVAIQSALGGGHIRAKRTWSYGHYRMLAILEIASKPMVHDLAALGVTRNKTHRAVYPPIALQLERHLIRGLYDGDGWIGERQFMLLGTEALLQGVQSAVLRHTGCLLTAAEHRGWPRLTGSRRDRPALAWMYEGATLSLTRKQAAWQAYWAARPPLPLQPPE